MCSNVYDGVTDLEAFGFNKSTKYKHLTKEKIVFFQLKTFIVL